MIELAKTMCPLLDIIRQRSGIRREMPDKKEPEETKRTNVPDLAGQFHAPEPTSGQRALQVYWWYH